MVISQQEYQLKPGETIEAYNARIAGLQPAPIPPPTTDAYGTPITPEPKIRNPITGGLEDNPAFYNPVVPAAPVRNARDLLMESEASRIQTATETAKTERERQNQLQQNSLEQELSRIETETQARIQEQEKIGAGNLAKTRGINIRAGLSGSPFAESLKGGVIAETEKAVASERQRGNERKSSASLITDQNIQKIEENYNARQAQIDEARSSLFSKKLEFTDAEAKQALGDFDVLAKSGNIDFEKLKDNGLLDGYSQQTGKSIGELELRFNAQLPQAEASDFRWGKNGEAYQYKKSTGEFIRRPDLDEGAGTGFEGKVQMLGDQVFIVPDKFTYDPTNPKSQADQLKDQLIPYGKTGQYQVPKATTEKPATSAQQTVAEYAARIEQSEPTLKTLTPFISKLGLIQYKAQDMLPSALQSSEFQQFDQASRNFINAKLRRESGAVISPTEFSEARKQYLPQPGDSEATLKLKDENRKLVFSSLKQAAGSAYSSVEDLLGGNAPKVSGESEVYTTPDGTEYIKGEDGLYYSQ